MAKVQDVRAWPGWVKEVGLIWMPMRTKMMEQPVELVADAGSMEARGELSCLPPHLGAVLSASL